MTQTINSTTVHGLFKAAGIELSTITEDTQTATLSTELGDSQDPMYAIIDIPSGVSGNFTFSAIAGNFGTAHGNLTVALVPNKMNIIALTSNEVRRKDGTAEFNVHTSNPVGLSPLLIKIGFVKTITVTNH